MNKSKAKKPKTSSATFSVPLSSKQLPATQGMVQLVRTELKSDIRELRSEMNARFSQVDGRVEQVMGAVHRVASEVARVGTLVEEQNSRNQIVLEGLTALFQRQERIESRLAD